MEDHHFLSGCQRGMKTIWTFRYGIMLHSDSFIDHPVRLETMVHAVIAIFSSCQAEEGCKCEDWNRGIVLSPFFISLFLLKVVYSFASTLIHRWLRCLRSGLAIFCGMWNWVTVRIQCNRSESKTTAASVLRAGASCEFFKAIFRGYGGRAFDTR